MERIKELEQCFVHYFMEFFHNINYKVSGNEHPSLQRIFCSCAV